jgi:hypothetical protein
MTVVEYIAVLLDANRIATGEHYPRTMFSTYLVNQSASRFIFRSMISEVVTVAGDINNPDPNPSR